jgi:hypothetical protein
MTPAWHIPIHITLPLNAVLPKQLKKVSDPRINAPAGIGTSHKQNSNRNNGNRVKSEFLW